MQELIRQLERVRGRARWMLLLMRGSTWLSAVIAAAVGAGLLDFLLRLPSWPRLVLGLVGLGVAVVAAVKRIGSAWCVNPPLTSLALRLERLDPGAAGHLASAVAFATQPDHPSDTPITRELTQSAKRQAGEFDVSQVAGLLDARHVYRSTAMLAVSLAVVMGFAVATPQSLVIAGQRWLTPFSGARWPNRYRIESMTTQKVAPNNAPVHLAAQVRKGDRPSLRTWVVYRFVGPGGRALPGGDWQRALMTRQSDAKIAGQYQRLLEPSTAAESVEFYFQAGDDQTRPQRVRLIEPPTLRRVTVQIDPPAYAREQVAPQQQDLLTPPRPSVSLDALAGSHVRLNLGVAGSFSGPKSERDSADAVGWIEAALPGLIDPHDDAKAMNLTVTAPPDHPGQLEINWTLRTTRQFHFTLADAYGSRYEDQRLFRFEALPDHPPRATVLEPAGDESVLATAVLPVKAEAFDDVAIRRLQLQARPPHRPAATLATEQRPQPRSTVAATLDLAPLKLHVGEELSLVAVVEDNYEVDGQTHPPVESPPRKLRIISPDELGRQLRTDLTELRERAQRAKAEQDELLQTPPDRRSVQQQQEVTDRVQAIQRTIEQLQGRQQMNRLDDDTLTQTLKSAQQDAGAALSGSQRAGDALQDAARRHDPQPLELARRQQKLAAQSLQNLVDLLDQGRDAYELKQKLVKLSKDQQALSGKTRETAPKTLGKTADQLSDADRRDLAGQSAEQKNLAEQAQQLVERMRATAAALSRQSQKVDDQAVAEAMRQAASHATDQSLSQKMSDAAKQVHQNQLSDAQQQQQQAQQVIQEMLQELGKTEELKQQILGRKLMQLAEAIRKLRDQQKAQLDRLNAAERADDLDEPLLGLRRNTQAVSADARGADPKAGPVADKLDLAVTAQGGAVTALRSRPLVKPLAVLQEQMALDALNKALKLAEDLARKAQQQLADKQRSELVKAYTKALAEQKEIRQQTQAMLKTPEAGRDRRWRGASMSLGNREADLRAELTEIKKKIEDTIVYRSVHEQMDTWTGDASAALRRSRGSGETVFQQQMVESSIQALIDALKPGKPNPEFAEDDGGGGGGGGGKAPLIPPLTELKLLRARQDQVHTMTRTIDHTPPGDAAASGRILDALGQQQHRLAELGQEMIQKLQQQNAQPGPGGKPNAPEKPQ